MPKPEGEAELRRLAQRFVQTEAAIMAWLTNAAEGDKREWLRRALELLIALRRLDLGRPVELAYIAEFPDGMPDAAVVDLAVGLSVRLHDGARTAAETARSIRSVR